MKFAPMVRERKFQVHSLKEPIAAQIETDLLVVKDEPTNALIAHPSVDLVGVSVYTTTKGLVVKFSEVVVGHWLGYAGIVGIEEEGSLQNYYAGQACFLDLVGGL